MPAKWAMNNCLILGGCPDNGRFVLRAVHVLIVGLDWWTTRGVIHYKRWGSGFTDNDNIYVCTPYKKCHYQMYTHPIIEMGFFIPCLPMDTSHSTWTYQQAYSTYYYSISVHYMIISTEMGALLMYSIWKYQQRYLIVFSIYGNINTDI